MYQRQKKPTYRNNYQGCSCKYYIVKLVYDAFPQGLDESTLRNQVKSFGVKFNQCLFGQEIGICLWDGYLKKSKDGLYYYMSS